MSDMLWLLITAQIVMGAVDTLVHHEFTERLAWRKSQMHELQLHGIRNLVYCGVFLVLGVMEIRGLLAVLALLALYGELFVTLKDFVEEDKTRKLPPSERVLHTLLALNYGAILYGITPVLGAQAGQPTGIAFALHGFWTLPCLVASLGTLVFGLRDLAASRRLKRMVRPAAADLLPRGPRRHILVTGGTGLIGTRLVEALVACGDDVTVLTRNPMSAAQLATPVRIVTSLDQIGDSEHIDAIVNLAGQPVVGFWTARYRRKCLRSRLRATRNVVRLIARLAHKPSVLVNGSAIGVYGAQPILAMDEMSRPDIDGGFAQRLCLDWERHALRAREHGVRTILLRIGIVLDTDGGSLGQMLAPFEYGLGGPFGDGKAWISWISRDDIVRLIDHVMRDPHIEGPVNGVAPEPVQNAAFVRALGKALHRPAFMPLPAFVLKGLLGDLGREIFLSSQFVRPARAWQSGFRFNDQRLDKLLERLVGSNPETPRAPVALTGSKSDPASVSR
ncbi:MAG TPA: TIGR01777 family oxidoreductase [Hyphomonadaceae bacterium]|jgi:uncharacterized protein (TIGR01777 family)|nr:TIGR01777 family oxidoreductase [Hyphomonadaceae bacterium]